MAEVIYKRISDLGSASQPLGGTEIAEISQGGVSKKVTLTSIFGSGWWAALRAAFTSFVAPEATHAVDSDTLKGESASDFHDAAQLTGAVPLASIPAQLTGKNAATATLAATATNATHFNDMGPSLFSKCIQGPNTVLYGYQDLTGILINESTGALTGIYKPAPPSPTSYSVPAGHTFIYRYAL